MSHPAFHLAEHGDAFLRAAEAAASVRSGHQFFVWQRLHLHRFVPHDLMLCHLARPLRQAPLPAQVFNSIPLEAPLVSSLAQAESPFWRALESAWTSAGRAPVSVPLSSLGVHAQAQGLLKAGFKTCTVHGADAVCGVQPALILAVAQVADSDEAWRRAGLQLCFPALYFALMRIVQEQSPGETSTDATSNSSLSARELEVLRAVRAARSNVEIGEQLGISALTVKNHLRKIMRKLGARSRVQAVAEAMSRQLIV
jgi:transcriptional regulator EpsA